MLLKNEKVFAIIEEPEAHLYPCLQKDVIEFISYFMNKTESTVFITTHSPYILTSINTLYCAGKTVREFPQRLDAVSRIVGEYVAISPETLSAFKIEPEGNVIDLCDNEMNEINTELIDEVSDQVSQKYMDLYWLQERERDVPNGKKEE